MPSDESVEKVNQAGECPVCGDRYDHIFDGLMATGDGTYVHKDPDDPARTLKMCDKGAVA